MKGARVIVIVAVLLLAGVVALEIWRNSEPRYQGRTLTDWLLDARTAANSSRGRIANSPEWQSAANAVQQMGTNAVPWLLKWVSKRDSKTKQKLIKWFAAHPAFHIRIRPAIDRQMAAYYGFSLLGSAAKSAWPQLVQMTRKPEPEARRCGMDCLIIAKADEATLRPVLNELVKDPDMNVQRYAAAELHKYFPEDAKAAGVYTLFPYMEHRPTIKANTNQSASKSPFNQDVFR